MDDTSSIGALLANLVPALRFTPVESLVLAPIADDDLRGVIRIDLADAHDSRHIARLADIVSDFGADFVIAVFVSEDTFADPQRAAKLADPSFALGFALAAAGVRLGESLLVDRLAHGGRWRSLTDPDRVGEVADPGSAVLAAAAAHTGAQVFESREQARDSLAVDQGRAAAVAALLEQRPVGVDLVDAIRLTVSAVQGIAEGALPTDAVLAEVGAALSSPPIVEVLYTLADSPLAAPSEALWTLLARSLPTALRVEALTLAALTRYLLGHGGLALVAIEAALDEDPDHQMARLLDTALQKGIHPTRIRALFAETPAALSL